MPQAPCLTTVPIKSATFSVTSVRKEIEDGQTNEVRLPPADAYFLMLYLEDADHADIEPDGTCLPVRHYERGTICLVDLKNGAAIDLYSRLHSLAFFLPKELFAEAASLSSGVAPFRLVCRRGAPDGVLRNLGMALLTLFGSGGKSSSPALLRHVAIAICAHLLHQYGERLQAVVAGGPLSVWQQMAAKASLLDKPAGEPPFETIAAAADLSADHFLQEFSPATGFTPYQWLAWMRVGKAKELLSDHFLSFEDIARRSGFSDMEHFNKVFVAETGMTPAAWRRLRLH